MLDLFKNIKAILTESLDDKGYKYRCVLIRAGLTTSANDSTVYQGQQVNIFKNYPEEVLKEAVEKKLFENVPALIRSEQEHLKMENTGVDAIGGTFNDVVWNEELKQVEGVFNVKRGGGKYEFLRKKLREVWEATKNIGLSIAGHGEYVIQNINNKFIAEVKKITSIQSVDPCTVGNAGGKFLVLVESTNLINQNLTETIMNPEIKQKIFDLLNVAGLIGEGKTIDQCSDNDLIEALWNHAITLGNVQDSSLTEAERTAKKTEVTNLLKSLITSSGSPAPAPVPGQLTESEQILAEAKKLLCESILDKELGDSKLPPIVKDKVRLSFKDKVFERTELTEVLKLEQKILAELMPERIDNGGNDIRFKTDKVDKLKLGFDFILMPDSHKAKLTEAERKTFKEAGVEGIYSIKELYIALTGDTKVSGYAQPGRLTEGLVTSDFSHILGNAIYRTMLKEYQEAIDWQAWRQICTVGSLVDFRSKPMLRMGGYTDLLVVNEDADFVDTTSPDDQEVTVQAVKRGYIDYITREMILNDDIGAIKLIPIKMGKAAARTLYKFAFNCILSNPTMPYDNKALFHADHNNLLNVALDSTNYGTARRALLDQTELNSLEKIGIQPALLLVPPVAAMEKMAYEILTTAFGRANDVPEWFQTWRVKPITVQHWTDPNNWVLMGNPNETPTVEIDFLQGQQEPQLFTQDTPASDCFFVKERLRYKIRHEYGGAPLDHRSFVMSVVTNP